MRFKLIMTFIKPDTTGDVVDAMKEAGATGATIIPARGTGIHEAKTFFWACTRRQNRYCCFSC